MSPTHVVEEVVGALWRPAGGGAGIEVALVRTRDGWSLPEGALEQGEHPLPGAVRAVWETTGHVGVPGRPLGQVLHLEDDRHKRVRYRALRVDNGSFVPSSDSDQLVWMSPRACRRLLRRDRDLTILTELTHEPEPTWPLVIVRHASAGQPPHGHGPEPERPLDPLGRMQARALVPVLDALRVNRVLSADVVRCVDTVGPFAAEQGIPVEIEPLVAETHYGGNVSQALGRMTRLMERREPVVVCSQGGVIPKLVPMMCRQLDQPPPLDATTEKGGLWILHLPLVGRLRLVALESFPAPPIVVTVEGQRGPEEQRPEGARLSADG